MYLINVNKVHTITGSLFIVALLGRNMFRYKQSSTPVGFFVLMSCCGQKWRTNDALRTPDQVPEGSGGANLRFPMGGLANGMPQNVSTNFPVEFAVWPEID